MIFLRNSVCDTSGTYQISAVSLGNESVTILECLNPLKLGGGSLNAEIQLKSAL